MEKKLIYKIKYTKAARFNAYRRLKSMDSLSTISISLLSAYIFITNLIPLFFPKWLDPSTVGFLTSAFSIFILILSVYEAEKNYSLLSYQFHECGKKLSKLEDRLQLLIENENLNNREKKIAEILNEYHDILGTYDINHDPVDSEKAYIYFEKENIKILRRVYINFFYEFKHRWQYYLLILLPLIFLFFL
ncbi:SLATT domain-containing protein [Pontibacter sp. G13]|uniref:SLATT domain-containing protein n=1 Tax=Pontibacter sp. G13 TaxID=3074898 RepID=UPI003905C0EC